MASVAGGRRAPWLLILGLCGLVVAGCDTPAPPAGPPRCEPHEEILVERRLKEGFRALAEGDAAAAIDTFRALLADEPGHPEALLGQRMARGGAGSLEGRPTARPSPRGQVVLGGVELPVELVIHHERWRFEERQRERALAAPAGASGERAGFGPRRAAGGDEVPLPRGLDLVILGDTGTTTARERFVALLEVGHAAHFLVDWDGRVYQTLDLAYAARGLGDPALAARAVLIELVGPGARAELAPLPEEALAAGVERPRVRVEVPGAEPVEAWGYPAVQWRGLERLLRALAQVLPGLELRGPAGEAAASAALDPSRATGLAGRRHLVAGAEDPGPGFDWGRLAPDAP